MRLRYLEFALDVDLPGKSMARNTHAFDPDKPQQGGFDLDLDLTRRLVKIEVPEARRSDRPGQPSIGVWKSQEGHKVYGLGPVCYVPLEHVKKFELAADAGEEPKLKAVKP